ERSHDQYYFHHLERITADPPPAPYLATDRIEIIRRVVVAEALRLAFETLHGQADFEGGSSVHGHFGDAKDWQRYRDRVIDALAGRRERLEAFCRSLLTRVRARDMTAPRLLAESIEGLIGRMDEIANVDGVADLSQRLAEHGLLPMFGFPTQVRHLYTRQ